MFNLRKNCEQKQTQNIQPTQTATSTVNASSRVLLEPKEVEINGIKFIISKMPCTVAQEVIFSLPNGLIPIVSDFKKAEEQAFKMLSYCERVYTDGRSNVPLISKSIIDNHVGNFDTLIKLEQECLKYNFDFFANGRAWIFCQQTISHVESKLSETLMAFLDKSSLQAGQLFGSLKTDTH